MGLEGQPPVTDGDVDGIDSAAVESCLSTRRAAIETEIDAEIRRAKRLGFRGTPSFILSDAESDTAGKIVGAQPYENFQKGMTKLKNR